MTDSPPSYDSDGLDQPSCPAYKPVAGPSESSMRVQQPQEEHGWNWIYESAHMVINLGSQSWGLHAPTYGFNGTIQGSVTFKGGPTHVEQVTATLEGKIKTVHETYGYGTHPIMSRTIMLYASHPRNATWRQSQNFSIPFPIEVFARNGTAKLPPSFATYDDPVLHSEVYVSYTLRFDMVRKGLRSHESRMVPIIYLPKSRPANPPVLSIPMPSTRLVGIPFSPEERIKTIPLLPKASSISSTLKETNFSNSIFLSLPSPLSFTAGEPIPFILSLVFPTAPALAGLLEPYFHLVLLRRIRVSWTKGQSNTRDTEISAGQVNLTSRTTEGITLLSGIIPAGVVGRECSWGMDGLVEIQHLVRASVCPPSIVAGHVPSYFHEETIDISTDTWGTHERELIATGGVPAPALGLASGIEKPFPS